MVTQKKHQFSQTVYGGYVSQTEYLSVKEVNERIKYFTKAESSEESEDKKIEIDLG